MPNHQQSGGALDSQGSWIRPYSGTEPASAERHAVDVVALLRGAQAGDDADSERLFGLIRPYVVQVASAFLGTCPSAVMMAEDVAQEALYRAFRSLRTCRAASEGEVFCWLRTITRRIAIEMLRTHGPRVSRHGVELTVAAAIAEDGLERDVDGIPGIDSPERRVFDAYDMLPDDSAQVVYLHLITACRWDDVGREMGISATAAKRRYQRAQHAIRTAVKRWSDAQLAVETEVIVEVPMPGSRNAGAR